MPHGVLGPVTMPPDPPKTLRMETSLWSSLYVSVHSVSAQRVWLSPAWDELILQLQLQSWTAFTTYRVHSRVWVIAWAHRAILDTFDTKGLIIYHLRNPKYSLYFAFFILCSYSHAVLIIQNHLSYIQCVHLILYFNIHMCMLYFNIDRCSWLLNFVHCVYYILGCASQQPCQIPTTKQGALSWKHPQHWHVIT